MQKAQVDSDDEVIVIGRGEVGLGELPFVPGDLVSSVEGVVDFLPVVEAGSDTDEALGLPLDVVRHLSKDAEGNFGVSPVDFTGCSC